MDTDSLILNVEQQVHINAGIDEVYAGVVHRFTVGSRAGDQPMPMVLEQWPGGRWFRDLDENTGHLWGHVQVIKPPTLIEICGPMFMSYPVAGHLSLRLTAEAGGTRVALRHRVLGEVEEAHREGLTQGWSGFLEDVQTHCEAVVRA